MATNTKYVYFSGNNFLDLGLDYSQLTLKGQGLQVVGTADIDRVFLRPGTTVNLVQSGGGSDKLYLEGSAADYTFSVTGTILNVTRGTGGTAESAQVSASAVSTDVLVFADGTVAATTLRDYAQSQGSGTPSALPVPTGETSAAPVLPSSYAGSARFVASSATTFAPVEPGIAVDLWGSVDVDTVYVNPGSTVLAAHLGGGQDLVYFTGAFGDYTKSILGTNVVFERDINGAHEKVTVARGTELNHDLWIFSDGAAGSYNTYQAVSQAAAAGTPVPALSTLADYDATRVTPGARPHAPVIAVAGDTDYVNAAASGVELDVRYDNIHSGDVLQVQLSSVAIGAAHTVSDAEAAAGYVTLTVAKSELGAVDGVKHLTVTASNRGGSVSSGELLVTLDTATPAAPDLVAVQAYAGAVAATASSGAVTVSAEGGSSVKVVFAVGSHQVEKLLVATGGAQAVALTAADLVGLGDGRVVVTAQATDAAANASPLGSTSFVLDTLPPASPTIGVVAGDDVLNRLESATTLTGTTEVDSTVSLGLGGRTVVANGTGHLDVTVTATDGGTPALSASQTFGLDAVAAPALTTLLAGVTNLDASSSLVLTASENVTAVAGKYLHIVDLGGSGYDGESTTHTQDILVTDTSQVHISGGRIVIDPAFDLDLGSNYEITVDDGAFVGASTHLATSAIGSSAIAFATVTPGTGSLVVNAASSQTMDTATGQLLAGNAWWSVEGVGSPGGSKVTADLSSAHVTLVFKDWNVAGGNAAAHEDGVGVKGSFWVDVAGFGADDLIYVDDQSNNALTANLLQYVNVDHGGTTPVRLAFDAAPGVGTEGQAWLDVTTTHGAAVFGSIAELSTLLGTTTSVVSA